MKDRVGIIIRLGLLLDEIVYLPQENIRQWSVQSSCETMWAHPSF